MVTIPVSVSELLDRTYAILTQRDGAREFRLNKPASPIVAEFTDDGSETGHMSYETAHVVRFSNGQWVVARGRPTGVRLLGTYDSDIIAFWLNVSQNLDAAIFPEILWVMIGRDKHLANTVALGAADGRLHFPSRSSLARSVQKRLEEQGSDILTVHRERLDDLHYRDASSQTERPVRQYRPAAALELARHIISVLEDPHDYATTHEVPCCA